MLMPKKITWGNLAACFLLFSFWIVLFSLTPDPRGFGTHEQLFLPPCFFHWLTQLPCPACGLTTSFAHLVNGNIMQAIHTHRLSPILFMMFVLLTGHAIRSLLKKQNFWLFLNGEKTTFVSMVLVIGLLINWVFVLVFDQQKTILAHFF